MPARPKTIMLPHTRPGGMPASWKFRRPRGRVDLHRLADELSLEVDALLPTVDTAVLLGMLRVEKRRRHHTGGQAFAQADIQAAKRFSAKPLSPCSAARQMEQALKAKSNRTLSEEFFRDLLDEHLVRKNPAASSKPHPVGRYAEIFDYDAATAS